MRFLIFAFLSLLPFGCKDETVSGYTDPATIWTLVELNGAIFPAQVTIAFPSEGLITGQAPCNSYSGRQSLPLPWFKFETNAMTQRACANLAYERRYFQALAKATLAEVVGDTMILSNDTGLEMVFKSTAQE